MCLLYAFHSAHILSIRLMRPSEEISEVTNVSIKTFHWISKEVDIENKVSEIGIQVFTQD